ncbi:MAG: hypothetical protein QXU98_08145 [Candidatus Parvarchaeota archaeon]
MTDFVELLGFAIVILAGDWFGIYIFMRYILNKISKGYARKKPQKNGTTIDITTKIDGYTTFRFYVWGEDIVEALMNAVNSLSKQTKKENDVKKDIK